MTVDGAEETAGFRLGYRPELDGVRAVAVVAVMAYHASINSAPGGYLGVDVFFVLSGFLITTLLVQERDTHGNVRLGAFYARRALRLFPALALVLVACSLYVLLRPDAPEVQGTWSMIAAAALYVANWGYALRATFRTDLVSHTWSLSIEEQFYLLWPVALVWLMGRRGGRRLALAVAAGLAVGLTLWRVWLYYAGTALPRVSWGLDTRAGALLLGAAIGLAAKEGMLPRRAVIGQAMAAVAAVELAWMFLSDRYGLVAISLDPGRQLVEGIVVADVAAALLVAGLVIDGGGMVGQALRLRPVVWVGKVSYGLYLWHFPIDVVVTSERTGLSGPLNQVLRLALTAAVVVASYVLVERPFLARKRRFERRRDIAVPAELVTAPDGA